jgi:cysteine synthase A
MAYPTALGAIGETPLIDLPSVRPEGGAHVLAKWEGANPTGSMKDGMALAMIEGAEADGDLAPGQHVLEFTGGSTGSSLALVCGVKGYPITLLTADCFAREKIDTMRALGAEVEVLETPEGKVHPGLFEEWTERVEELIPALDAHFTDQFNNPHHPAGYRPLGHEIAEACPEVTDFVVGVGTGGSAMGTARGLRDRVDDVKVTLVEPAESAVLSGGDSGSHGIEGIALGFQPPYLEDDTYDDVLPVPEARARETARTLARRDGLFAGTSTGMNVAAAAAVAAQRDPDDAVVTVAVDSGLKYLHGELYR